MAGSAFGFGLDVADSSSLWLWLWLWSDIVRVELQSAVVYVIVLYYGAMGGAVACRLVSSVLCGVCGVVDCCCNATMNNDERREDEE
jgi:hypothetical protein